VIIVITVLATVIQRPPESPQIQPLWLTILHHVTAGNQLLRAGGARKFHGKSQSGQDKKLSFRLPFFVLGVNICAGRLQCVWCDSWSVMPTVRALVGSLDVQQDRRQLVADTLQELGYLLDEQAGEALGALTEAQLQKVRVKGAGLNVREINALLVRFKPQGEFLFHWLDGQ